jgi:succinoglycan biosynthesis protein ExoA
MEEPSGSVLRRVDRPAARVSARRDQDGADVALPGDDILIVIPSLNEEKHLAGVIDTLRRDENCAGALIVVADGGSSDQTVAIAETIGKVDPRVCAIPTPTPLGISASVNKAVQKYGAGRKWLVRIDAHAEYPANYVSRLVAKAVELGADSVVTPMVTRGSTCFQKAAAAAQNSILGTGGAQHRTGRQGGWVEHGHHALMRLDIFLTVGGYDETFTHNEDAELDHRIVDAGGRIWLAEDLPLVYYPRGTARSLARQYFLYGRGRARTVARHPSRRRLRQVAPLVVAPAILLAAASPLFWQLALPVLLWAGVCLVYGITKIGHGVCAAASGVMAMLMHAAWSFGYWSQLVSFEPPAPFRAALAAPTSP